MPSQPKDNPERLFNILGQKPFRQTLRSHPTEPEQKLWRALRSQQLGVKFRRQHGIGAYVVDFYCAEIGLIIEIDGDSHFHPEGITHDQLRDDFLREKGLRIFRFNNQQIMNELDAVLSVLLKEIAARKPESI